MGDFLLKRGEYFYFLRRIPSHLKKIDSRPYIRVSLKTKDSIEATRRSLILNARLEKYWKSLAASNRSHSENSDWQDIINLLRLHGYSYKIAEQISGHETTESILERLNTLKVIGQNSKSEAALLGLENIPEISLSAALETYFSLTKDRLVGKSSDFIRKWQNPRKKAVNNFVKATGVTSLGEINRSHINKFHLWWMEKITKNDMVPTSASKDMIHLKDVIRVTAAHYEIELDVDILFSSAKFKKVVNSRSPFDAAFVKNEILQSNGLDGLDAEAKAVVYLMADTGARVSEIVGLLPEDISLNGDIPFIWIRPNKNRSLKNKPSIRQIPLTGFALTGAIMIKDGFNKYKTGDAVSAVVNRYFEEKKLRPTDKRTLYSLRHTFKDRLRDINAPEEVIDELMGHAGHRPKYGRGHTLESKKGWLSKISF